MNPEENQDRPAGQSAGESAGQPRSPEDPAASAAADEATLATAASDGPVEGAPARVLALTLARRCFRAFGRTGAAIASDSFWRLALDASFQPATIAGCPDRLGERARHLGPLAFAVALAEIGVVARLTSSALLSAALGLIAGALVGWLASVFFPLLVRVSLALMRLKGAPPGAPLLGRIPFAPLLLYGTVAAPFTVLVPRMDPWLFLGAGVAWGTGALAGALHVATSAPRRSLLVAVVLQLLLAALLVAAAVLPAIGSGALPVHPGVAN